MWIIVMIIPSLTQRHSDILGKLTAVIEYLTVLGGWVQVNIWMGQGPLWGCH